MILPVSSGTGNISHIGSQSLLNGLTGNASIQRAESEIKKRMLTLGDMAELKGWALSIGRKLPFILSVSIL
jgi:hypothetical protein